MRAGAATTARLLGQGRPASLNVLRATLDRLPTLAPPAPALVSRPAATPRGATPAAPRGEARPVLAVHASNVWGVPRPHVPALSRLQWRGLACFALALGCLWYLDALTTAWALKHGGVEGGPIARFLVGHNMIPLLAAKTVGLGLIILIAAVQIARHRERLAGWSLGLVGSLSIGIVEWNLLAILLLAGVIG